MVKLMPLTRRGFTGSHETKKGTMKNLVLCFTLVVSIPSFAADEGVLIHNGFGTGQAYLEMSSAQKRAYAMGVINGMLLAPLFSAPKKAMLWLESCAVNMTDSQVAAILTKYLEQNPGRWHETPHAPMFVAMKDACPKGRVEK